jgi:hypothetical protein
MARSASMLLAARGATVGLVSEVGVASGNENPVELVFFAPDDGAPNVVPFGP